MINQLTLVHREVRVGSGLLGATLAATSCLLRSLASLLCFLLSHFREFSFGLVSGIMSVRDARSTTSLAPSAPKLGSFPSNFELFAKKKSRAREIDSRFARRTGSRRAPKTRTQLASSRSASRTETRVALRSLTRCSRAHLRSMRCGDERRAARASHRRRREQLRARSPHTKTRRRCEHRTARELFFEREPKAARQAAGLAARLGFTMRPLLMQRVQIRMRVA